MLTSRLGTLQRLEVSEEIDLLALAAEEAARYDEVSVSGTSLTVQGDARLLRRVIRNLLDNAIRYGLPPIELSVAAGGENALMQVKDHGPGIAAADRDRIFEPFIRVQTSAPQEKSAGLGLALVRQIARLHGGDASVSEGSTFSVSLPRCGI